MRTRADVARDLRDYSRIGADERMRHRCELAAEEVEGGTPLFMVRDQLQMEVRQGDLSLVASLIVNYGIYEGAR